jgi:hypothetical protein
MKMNKVNNSNSSLKESRKRKAIERSTLSLTAVVTALAIVLSSPTTIQPAFAHADIILPINIGDEEQQGRGIVIVIGHSDEPAYGAKSGIHDGLHGLEVSISDNATGLPIGDAELRADKYYFTDLESFNSATSVEDADQVQEGIERCIGLVFAFSQSKKNSLLLSN